MATKMSIFILMTAIGILITMTGWGLDKLEDQATVKARINRIMILGKFNVVLGLTVIALAATLGRLN